MPLCFGEAPRRGFTIVELMVSLAIIGMIASFTIANFRGGQQSAETRLASDILVSQIRALQTEALSGRLVAVCSGGSQDLKVCEPGKTPPVSCGSEGVCQKRVMRGYGIRLSTVEPEAYLIFADADGDAAYDVGEELHAQPYVSTGTVRFLSANVGSPVDLVFVPPFAQISVNGVSSGPPDVLTLTIGHEATGLQRNVKVFRISGKVEHD